MQLSAKMKIFATPLAAYEVFADPEKIGGFWFSTSSKRWEAGETVAVTYVEYGAAFELEIIRAVPAEEIIFEWGKGEHRRTCSLLFAQHKEYIIVEAREAGWKKDTAAHELLQNQTGWVFMLTCLKAYLENGVCTLRTGLVLE